jgi:hypothetical protein
LKSVLIISPSFPPINAADMHRVRQSVSYFEDFGWKPTVVTVKACYNEASLDDLLVETLPENLEIIEIKALSSKWTRKMGLGALGLRAMPYYFWEVNKLLKNRKFDLIYFSTTMFPVLILGSWWKKKFKIPFIIDMQDPWHSDYYENKPKSEQPPKYWFSYRLNKYLEPIAMKNVDGIIAVSQGYCTMLQERYANIIPENCTVIPFGVFPKDFDIIEETSIKEKINQNAKQLVVKQTNKIQCVYVGRGGADMSTALQIIFGGFKLGLLKNKELFQKISFHFIGTSYAPGEKGKQSILPIAKTFGLEDFVQEYPARVPYFESLTYLKNADLVLIPGSEDPNYTASKLYPYIMSKKPILAVFSETSSVVSILNATKAGEFVTFKHDHKSDLNNYQSSFYEKMIEILIKIPFTPATNWAEFEPYTAKKMTEKQVLFFNKCIEEKNS